VRGTPQPWWKYGAVLLLVSAATAAALRWYSSGQANRDRPIPQPDPDPPDAPFVSPYRNTQPGVKYVGDQSCLSCHREYRSYSGHPMGRSFAPSAEAPLLEEYGPSPSNPLKLPGLELSVQRKDGHVYHKVVYTDAAGKPVEGVAPEVHEAAYALGSGAQGRSYLVQRGGALFQSPISWFSRKKDWGLSPGYQHRFLHFQRPVLPHCVYCHCDRAQPVPDSLNRYFSPAIKGQSIGCERCHGPGELHAAGRLRRDEFGPVDYTIVNPRRLEPPLRDAICQQCHLQGEAVVLRRGKTEFDYRPGLPLQDYVAVFVRPPHLANQLKAVTHAEQLRVSVCAIRSKGKLGCASCHDPHYLPKEEERVSYYRGDPKDEHGRMKRGCYSCHTETSCHLTPVERRRRNPQDSCIDCHMPARPGARVAHSAVTDHRILRDPARAASSSAVNQPLDLPIVHFHRDLVRNDADTKRDLSLALVALQGGGPGSAGEFIRSRVLPGLDIALKRHPDDVLAWIGRGHAQALLGENERALEAFSTALKLSPDHEEALYSSARLLAQVGRLNEALDRARRLVRLNPWVSQNQHLLADVLIGGREWEEAATVIRNTLASNPGDTTARAQLVDYHLHRGDREAARAEYGRIMALNPLDRDEIELRFRQRLRERP
jgi:tetratricopeptide (TPR) repeat protein